jgi:hypothetical protein
VVALHEAVAAVVAATVAAMIAALIAACAPAAPCYVMVCLVNRHDPFPVLRNCYHGTVPQAWRHWQEERFGSCIHRRVLIGLKSYVRCCLYSRYGVLRGVAVVHVCVLYFCG